MKTSKRGVSVTKRQKAQETRRDKEKVLCWSHRGI